MSSTLLIRKGLGLEIDNAIFASLQVTRNYDLEKRIFLKFIVLQSFHSEWFR